LIRILRPEFLNGDDAATVVASLWLRIWVIPNDGTTPANFDQNTAGFTAAVAFAGANGTGGLILMPPCTIANNHTIPGGYTVGSIGFDKAIFTGQLTLSADSALVLVEVVRTGADGTALTAIVGPSVGTAYVQTCPVTVVNTDVGDTYCMQAEDGNLIAMNSVFQASSTDGKAVALLISGDGITKISGSKLSGSGGANGFAVLKEFGSTGEAYLYDCQASGSTTAMEIAVVTGTTTGDIGDPSNPANGPFTLLTIGMTIYSGFPVDVFIPVDFWVRAAGADNKSTYTGSWTSISKAAPGGEDTCAPGNTTVFQEPYLIRDGDLTMTMWMFPAEAGVCSGDYDTELFGAIPGGGYFHVKTYHIRFTCAIGALSTTSSITIVISNVDGFEVIEEAGAGDGIYTYSVQMDQAEGMGIPLPGDLSTWDALAYQAQHANDIDDAAGIHHTLGTGAGQAAEGDHVHDAADVTYTPAVLTDWDGDADPGDVDNALDQLAERVDDVETGAIADHDHSGDAGDGNTFDAANLTSAAATDGQVLTADGAGGAAWEDPAGGAVDASIVTYTPAVLTDWDGDADPGDVDNALDQLAERVDDLEGAGGGGHTIQEEGTPLTARANLNFVGSGVAATDDAGNDATVVTINAPAAVVRQFCFLVPGPLTVGSIEIRIPNRTGATRTITEVRLDVGTAPTGASLVVDVNRDGTTIFTTQSNRPAITAGNTTGNTTTIEVDSWSDSQLLTFDIDQVGSTIAGSDLTITVVFS
jgi:hypothetical protein